MEQINQKGRKYIRKIPFKRIFITLLKFDIAVLIFLIINLLFKEEMSLKQLLLSFIGWDSLGNSNWYIFTILMLYIFTYISFVLIKNKKISFVITACLTCIYIFILYHFNIKPLYWYDTALCYILGMFYSLFKDKIYKYINFNNITYIITLILTVVGCLMLKKYSYYASINILFNLIFSILIVIITMRVLINNKILLWCGEHLFEIYILQRIPMIIFQRLNLFNNIYLFFVVCVVSTLIIVLIFKKIVNSYILKKFSLNK